ncbi:glycoside hydrolase family 20 protein [Flaviaesturariibacter flavus]|uniref:glycoside hydrolase family 20 protein n=1 Tax=Flaviaesturariibacter flavus TaxID=2502780 RepID=UPI00140513E7|nr:family 20 glycosylhydrolase [Flaviaesturariibacter flavus]
MKRLLCLLAFGASLSAGAQAPALFPQPAAIKTVPGSLTITPQTPLIASDDADARIAAFFNDRVQELYGFRLPLAKQGNSGVRFVTRRFIKAPDKDAYLLRVDGNGVKVEGDTYAGTFYGLQTLLQLLPEPPKPAPLVVKVKERPGKTKVKSVLEKPAPPATRRFALPRLLVQDAPRFAYRGMHLDVCRHFFSVSFIKRYIDLLAMHKMNTFHWHLTDDQGWRIEIKKYPGLTNVGGWRNGTIIGRYPGSGNDNERYGGFYTQDEVKEVVAYAAARYITILPEIEMPGHSSAAIAAYPFLSCFPAEPTVIPSWPSEGSKAQQAAGRPKQVQETWGVFYDIFCAGKDSTFDFLEGVLDEVIALFPGKYVHVGGDEAPKSQWKRCPNCQARMKANGLKDEHELQSYFIRRIEKFVNAKGRSIIGWDEILEGGLAPNAAIMSWQGERGGIEAAKQQHVAVMTPQKPCYFDYAQAKPEDSLVWGGYNPLDSVYAYEPLPRALDSAAACYIIGAQANLWTEYMSNPAKVEYMALPRMAALSEALWTPPAQRSWASFERRLPELFARYDRAGYTASRAYYNLQPELLRDSARGGLLLRVRTRLANPTILYTRNPSSESSLKPLLPYPSGGIPVSGTDSIVVALITPQKRQIHSISYSFHFNKATARPVTLQGTPSRNYPGLGALSLANGIYSSRGLASTDWLGFLGGDIDATIDLGKPTPVSTVRLHTLDQNGSWIYLPQYVEVFTSDDGRDFRSIGQAKQFVKDSPTNTQGWITLNVPETSARYIRVLAKNYGLIPEGQPGAGTRAWLFADEIDVQ